MKLLAQKRKKIFLEENAPKTSEKSPFDNFYYKEVARLTASGGWSINFIEKKSFLDPEGHKILRTPAGYRLSLKNALEFYAPGHKETATNFFVQCANGAPFATTIKMLTYDKKEFWAEAIGKPILDDDDTVIGIQGIFRDVTSRKLKEYNLEQSVKMLESQNTRLINFANIVSHNLRSHTSNLQLTMELLNDVNGEEEEKELKESLAQISSNLSTTMDHLNELVSIHSRSLHEKRTLRFDETLERVKIELDRIVVHNNYELYTDFSEVPEIDYIPSYLDSILINLMSNALKYRHPDRTPVIDIFSYSEDGHSYLMVKDNGLGIDLEANGNRMFQMYETFHDHPDSVGIGLFIVKSQVEAMRGTIKVESEVDKGTTFTIRLTAQPSETSA